MGWKSWATRRFPEKIVFRSSGSEDSVVVGAMRTTFLKQSILKIYFLGCLARDIYAIQSGYF